MSFTCQHAGCGRVYLRAEHLNRHARSHDRPTVFTCEQCGSKMTRRNNAPTMTPQAWKTTTGDSSMRIMEELECSDNDECDGPEGQQSMALSAPKAECPGKRLMYDKLLAIYFDKFHHHWPIIHRELTLSRSVPQVLLRTVVTVGLHLSDNLEAKALANSTLERFLEQSGILL
ncbi:hypothetical protein BN1723_017507, partial [Verticillium longisporum]